LDLGSGGGDAAQAEAFFSSFGFGDAIQAAVASIWNPLIEGITSGLNASLNANNTPLDLNNDDLKIDIAQNGPGQVGYAAGIVAPFLFGGGEARLGAEALIEAAEGLEGAATTAAKESFFDGTQYTQKVLTQMQGGAGEFHSFPESVTAFESAGSVRTITGGDGVVRQMLEIPGSYGGRDGVFQFIQEADGSINHRLFVPGGTGGP
jgi:filamentous hemagglutinin